MHKVFEEVQRVVEQGGLFTEVDTKQLEDRIKVKYGIDLRVTKTSDGIEAESPELIDRAGVLKFVFVSLILVSTQRWLSDNKRYYWMRLSFKWRYKDGGSNGAPFLDVWWDFKKKKWIIKGAWED